MDAPVLLSDDSSHTAESLMSILLSRYLSLSRTDAVTETLFDALLQLIEELRRKTHSDPVVDMLIHAITTSCNNPEFQVTDALLATGYSKDHLRRCFQQATGMTPHEYLTDIRIRYAKRLLTQKIPISEAALLCGYYDPDYFCRLFRAQTGMAPTAYHKKRAAVQP